MYKFTKSPWNYYHSLILFVLFNLVNIANINAQSISKNSEIYDYQVGDIFHFELNASTPSSGSHIYTNIEIMSKYYSVLQDTVFYIQSRANHAKHSWAPNWTFSKTTDTIFFTQLDSLVNSGNIDIVFIDTTFNGRKVNKTSSDPYASILSIYVDGCGHTYYKYNQTSPITHWEEKLIYYKKGNEVWGTPIPLFVNKAQNKLSMLKIFPNPSRGVINLDVSKDIRDFEVRVLNSSGRLIFKTNNKRRIDLSKVDCGLYYVQIITNETSKIQKLMLIKE